MRTVSENNLREHWAAKARRVKAQREGVFWWLHAARVNLKAAGFKGKILVKLTRVSLMKLDGDNLQGALKACRDGVADALGMDDGDERITWRYRQREPRTPRKSIGLAVEVEFKKKC